MTDHFRLKKLDFFLADHFGADQFSDFFLPFSGFSLPIISAIILLNSFFRLSSNHFSDFFLARTPDHFQTIICVTATG